MGMGEGTWGWGGACSGWGVGVPGLGGHPGMGLRMLRGMGGVHLGMGGEAPRAAGGGTQYCGSGWGFVVRDCVSRGWSGPL